MTKLVVLKAVLESEKVILKNHQLSEFEKTLFERLKQQLIKESENSARTYHEYLKLCDAYSDALQKAVKKKKRAS